MPSNSTGSCKTLFLHGEGVVCLTYSPDAKYLYSSGSDCIRCLDINDPLECLATIGYHKKPVTYLDCSADYLVSCSESGETVLHQHSSVANQPASFRSLLTRFSLPSRCVRFSPDYKKVAVCSDELTIKIIDVDQPMDCRLLAGHSKSPKSLTWSPASDLLVSSGCDGTIRIWKITSDTNIDDPECIQTIEGVIPLVFPDDFKAIEAVWHPSGNRFVVPTREENIAVFEPNCDKLWKKTRVVQLQDTSANRLPDVLHGHKFSLTSSAFSPNGAYLATGFEDGLIIVWDTQLWRYVCHSDSDLGACITSVRWKPHGNALVIGDQQGQIITWTDVIPSNRDNPSASSRITNNTSGMKKSISAFDVMDGDTGDFDSYGGAIDDDDWVIDDTRPAANLRASDSLVYTTKYAKSTQSLAHYKSGYSHQPFQSGATKLRLTPGSTGDQSRRYMAFNSVGLAQVLEKDTENIITVEFHDRGKRAPYHFTDRLGFNLCSISELGVAFACQSTKSGTGESLIRYDPYESWATEGMSFAQLGEVGSHGQGGWQYTLPRGENATCLACGGSETGGNEGVMGSGSVVVGTSKGYIRIFTGSGIQSYVWNLGHHIISLACSDEWLFVVHCSATNSSGPLQYSMMDTDTLEIIQEGTMPLSNGKVCLSWIGFSSQDRIPACFASSGVLSFLDKARRPKQGRWVPVLDTESLQKPDALSKRIYWPIGVSESQLSCMILRGGENQPGFPTPLVQELDLNIPLLRQDENQGRLEESYLRGTILCHNHSDLHISDDDPQLASQKVELDKQLLKLIQTCCNHSPTPELQKALDYANLLQNITSLEAASKISQFFKLVGLNDRITKVKESKELQAGIIGPGKRVSKYAHLEDYDIITRPKLFVNERGAGSRRELFDSPFDNAVSKAHSQGGGGLLSRGNVFKRPLPERIQHNDDEMNNCQESDETQDWAHTAEDTVMTSADGLNDHGQGDGSGKQLPRLSQYHLGSEVETQKSTSTNPFAKKLLPRPALKEPCTFETDRHISPPSTNPFSSKSTTSKPSGSVKKSAGAFFDRVDERGGVSGSVSKGKGRQSTLFGLPPKASETAVPEEESKKGRKRKNEAEGKSAGGEKPRSKASRPLSTFLAKSTIKPAPVQETNQSSCEGADVLLIPETEGVMKDLINRKVGLSSSSVADNKSTGGSVINQQTEDDSQVSLMSIDFEESLPPRVRSTFPLPDVDDDRDPGN